MLLCNFIVLLHFISRGKCTFFRKYFVLYNVQSFLFLFIDNVSHFMEPNLNSTITQQSGGQHNMNHTFVKGNNLTAVVRSVRSYFEKKAKYSLFVILKFAFSDSSYKMCSREKYNLKHK